MRGTKGTEICDGERNMFPLGVTADGEKLHLAVAAGKETCRLMLYEAGKKEPAQVIDFPESGKTGDVWTMTVTGENLKKYEYCFEVDGELVPDAFGRAFTGRETWGDLAHVKNPVHCLLGNDAFDWEGDAPLRVPYEETIIYRIHPRGFTKHASSKVKNKGTFKGIEEKIPYLKELGITALELMPVYEFEEVVVPEHVDGNPYGDPEPTGKLNYWGYTKGFYFAPKASYASGRKKEPVREFKELVRALHKNGIEVITELYFTGKESPDVVQAVVRFWVQEYHVDGVHLVGYPAVESLRRDPYLTDTKLLYVSWGDQPAAARRHLGEYNDGFMVDMRRFLKGDEDQLNNLIFRSRRNPAGVGVVNYMATTNGFTLMDMVSYDMKHNEANGENNQDGAAYNYSWNCGVEGPTRKKKIADLRKKQLRNALLLLFLSQGTPMLLGGDEFGNTQNGNNNAYCQDNEISWLNWNLLKTNSDLYEFVRALIKFRKSHPVFHMEKEPMIMDYLACGHPDVSYHGVKAWCPEFENFRRQLGIMYCGEYGKRADGTNDDYFFVAYNMHWEPHEFALPNLPKGMKWHVAFNSDDLEPGQEGILTEGAQKLAENQKQFEVGPRTIVVFCGRTVDGKETGKPVRAKV